MRKMSSETAWVMTEAYPCRVSYIKAKVIKF